MANHTVLPKSPIVLNEHYLAEDEDGDIIAGGIIAPESLSSLGYDTYQRNLGTTTQREKLRAALNEGSRLTTVNIGMRGAHTKDKGGSLYLLDPVYVIDGRQRLGTLLEWLGENPKKTRAQTATVSFNTHFDSEQRAFIKLNLGQRPISPSKIFAEMRSRNPGILAVYGLSNNDRNFALHQRTSWEQNLKREDLMTGRGLLIVACHLHSHLVQSRGYTVESVARSMNYIVDTFGITQLRENLRTFFEVVDSAWDVRNVPYRGGKTQLHLGFLMSLARVFSDHHDFWSNSNKNLDISDADIARLKKFRLDDDVKRLVEGTSKGRNILRGVLIEALHFNRRGKLRVRQLTTATQEDIELAEASRSV